MSSPAPRSGRSLGAAQAISMLLVFLLLAGAGGVLSAGFAMPVVGLSSAVLKATQDVFEELPSDFNILEPSELSVIKASDGTQIAQFYAENRIVVPLTDIDTDMRNAVVAVEDRRFYQHKGVDPAGMLRAVVANASSDSTQGASTLTQQYVRNVLIEAGLRSGDASAVSAARGRSYARKIKEVKYALTLEKTFPNAKEKILEGYLNIAAFSPSTYGVEASAQHYFSHSAKDMTVAEAALIAGLTNAPSAYDPVTNPDAARSRMEWVLKKMLEEQFIDQAQYDEALATPLDSMLHVTDTVGGCGAAGNAAYFCNYVVSEILNSSIYGADVATRRQLLLRGGLTITTTLDLGKQQAAYDTIQGYVPTGDPSNAKAVLVSVEPGTGRILSMAQNTNYGDPSGVDTTATQISLAADAAHEGTTSNGFQPGSVFKTIVLAEWFRLGKSAYTTTNTTPRTFTSNEWTISCNPGYIEPWPVDNASASEAGRRSVYESSRQSINVGFAEMLTQMDICDVTRLASSLGIKNADGTDLTPVPSIILGTMNSTPVSVANAYATFAAHGTYCTPVAIDSITSTDGSSLEVPPADCTQAVDPTVADQVTSTLTATFTSAGTATTARLSGRPAAGKTGTTDMSTNIWFVGFTPQLSTAAWVGHSDGDYSLSHQYIGGTYYGTVYGADVPAPMWRDYMNAALAGAEVQQFNNVSLGTKETTTSRSRSTGTDTSTGAGASSRSTAEADD